MKDKKEKAYKLGVRLKSLRQGCGLSQEQLAERAGFHPTYVAKLEAGLRIPSLEALDRLAAALDSSMARIIEAMDTPTEAPPPDERTISEIHDLLHDLTRGQATFIRDVIQLVRRHDPFDL